MNSEQTFSHAPRKLRAAMLGATALGATLAASPAWAQPSDEAAVDNNTIIVTAQRRSEALEDVPMSVAVVSADTLATASVTNLRDLANVTSGYQLGAGGAFPQPAIRGVTTVINGTYENNVAVYVDELYQPVAQVLNIDLPNIENVQILKGPQGTLYGRNATGGALLLTTATPTDTWHGKAELTYARFDDKRASGYVAGPIADSLGVSLAGYSRRSDGYARLASRTTPGQLDGNAAPIKQDMFRGKLKFGFTDNFTATLLYNYTRVFDIRTNMYSPLENVPGSLYNRPGGATRPTTLGVEAYDLDDVQDARQHEAGLILQLDTELGTLKSISGFGDVTTDNRFDFDGSYIPSSYSRSKLHERSWQQAVDFTVKAINNVDLIVGGTFFDDKIHYDFPQTNYSGLNPNNPGTTPGTINDYIVVSQSLTFQHKRAWAAYADLNFHVNDQLSIDVGGRYSEEKQTATGEAVGIAVLARPRTTSRAKFKKFTPRASIRYEIAPRTNVYASYSQGFRSGAFNSQLPAAVLTIGPSAYAPAQQETIDAYEVGFKTAQRNLRVELAGFYYKYKNLQVSTTKTVGGFPFVDVTNAPRAKIYGAEATVEFDPIENLTLRANGTWLHARYGSGFLFGGVGVSNSVAAGSGIGINTNSDPLKTYLNVTQQQDLSGLQMARAPNFTGNFGMDYNIPMQDGGLRFAANVRYTTSYVLSNPSIWGPGAGVPADRVREQRFRENAFALLSASITWTEPSGHAYVRVWGTNLTNHTYRLHYSGTTNNGTYAPMAEPRVYGGTIGYKF